MGLVDSILRQRGRTHGDWPAQAALAHRLKEIMRRGLCFPLLWPAAAEALDMIAVKLSRIVCGNALHGDHWADICGYARLAERAALAAACTEPHQLPGGDALERAREMLQAMQGAPGYYAHSTEVLETLEQLSAAIAPLEFWDSRYWETIYFAARPMALRFCDGGAS